MAFNKQKKHSNIKSIINLNKLFPDLDKWPESWAGFDNDIPVGKFILEDIKAFLNQQKSRVSKKTLKIYGDYLWALGGEIIRDTNENEITVDNLDNDFLLKYVDESGGPYWRHAENQRELERYDSICRRFYKYLIPQSCMKIL